MHKLTFFNKLIIIISKYKWLLILIILILIGIVYKFNNPYEVNFLPKCSFYKITGYQCPGCGSQRAIHEILNFHFINAIKENLLLVILIPYLLLGAYWDLFPKNIKKYENINNLLFGYKTLVFIFFIILFFWIFRNMTIYNNFIHNL